MASDINNVIILGRLTREAELSYTSGGTAVLKFSLAVNECRKDAAGNWVDNANYFDCTAWGKMGENLKKYLVKGKKIAVQGRLKQDRWQSQDGQNHSRVSIVADAINFCDAGGNNNNAATPTEEYQSGVFFNDDEIPFN